MDNNALAREKDTLRAVAELEVLKQQLLSGVAVDDIVLDDLRGSASKRPSDRAAAEGNASSAAAIMESMAQMDQELDEQMRVMAAALAGAKAQRAELCGMHSDLQAVRPTPMHRCAGDTLHRTILPVFLHGRRVGMRARI